MSGQIQLAPTYIKPSKYGLNNPALSIFEKEPLHYLSV